MNIFVLYLFIILYHYIISSYHIVILYLYIVFTYYICFCWVECWWFRKKWYRFDRAGFIMGSLFGVCTCSALFSWPPGRLHQRALTINVAGSISLSVSQLFGWLLLLIVARSCSTWPARRATGLIPINTRFLSCLLNWPSTAGGRPRTGGVGRVDCLNYGQSGGWETRTWLKKLPTSERWLAQTGRTSWWGRFDPFKMEVDRVARRLYPIPSIIPYELALSNWKQKNK